jgi:acetylornithine deacetylase/succinyl-diaminopimelate desuccinylase-like protein
LTDIPSTLLHRSLAIADAYLEPIVELTSRLTAIPAPSNDELERSAVLQGILSEMGYGDVAVDEIGNVTARIPGKDRSKTLLVAAHIDTVFPRGVDLTVRRVGDTLHAPGVGDNTVAVAAVAHFRKAFDELGETPACDIVITGNVGEEGLGDLRGMKAVVASLPDIIGAIAVEGQSLGTVVHDAVGSKRYLVTVTGPGGHSWGAAGTPSAVHHLARLIARMDDIPLSDNPKTSFNTGTFHGGISVNTISPEAHALLDIRSVSAESLQELVDRVDEILASSAPAGIHVEIEIVGDRPAGSQPEDGVLVRIADQVLVDLGIQPRHRASSTDANVPIALGIPSVCIGVTNGDNVHREDEYINLQPIPMGFAHMLTVILQAAEALV